MSGGIVRSFTSALLIRTGTRSLSVLVHVEVYVQSYIVPVDKEYHLLGKDKKFTNHYYRNANPHGRFIIIFRRSLGGFTSFASSYSTALTVYQMGNESSKIGSRKGSKKSKILNIEKMFVFVLNLSGK